MWDAINLALGLAFVVLIIGALGSISAALGRIARALEIRNQIERNRR